MNQPHPSRLPAELRRRLGAASSVAAALWVGSSLAASLLLLTGAVLLTLPELIAEIGRRLAVRRLVNTICLKAEASSNESVSTRLVTQLRGLAQEIDSGSVGQRCDASAKDAKQLA